MRNLSHLEKTDFRVEGNVNVLKEDFSSFFVISESTKIEPGKERDIRNSMSIRSLEELIHNFRIIANLTMLCGFIAISIYWIAAKFNYDALEY
jgi:hypothetical protein